MPKGVKKADGKNIEKVRGLSESQAWTAIGQKCLNPCSMFRRASAATGCYHTQGIAVLSAFSATFMTELNDKGTFFLPGFGTFHKTHTPRKPGKMMNVFGKWKAVAPVQAKTEIVFIPFQTIIEVMQCDGMSAASSPSPAGGVSAPMPGAARAAPATPPNLGRPAAAHSAAPSVIPAPDADDNKGDNSDSSDTSWDYASDNKGDNSDAATPAAALQDPR